MFSCSHKDKSNLSTHKKEKIERFLKDLLIENAGIYTLYGDKPISEILFYTGNLKSLENAESLNVEQDEIFFVESETILKQLSNWRLWKDYQKTLKLNNFGFIEISPPNQTDYCFYYIINFEAARKVIEENLHDFTSRLGIDLSNYKKRLMDPQSILWTKGFTDHYLMGLLYGFGKENAEYFVSRISNNEALEHFEIVEGPYNEDNLPIPLYGSCKEDVQKQKFYFQKESIQKHLKNKNFVDEVLKKLTE